MPTENSHFLQAKAALRTRMREALARISPTVNAVESIALCDRLQPQLRSAGRILFFAPLPGEPDIWPLLEASLKAGKTIALPWFNPATQTYLARQVTDLAADIVTGKFGVREPAVSCPEMPVDQFHLVLVPGLAFDAAGNRLGRGKGYYDRLLQGVKGVKCGICHDLQLQDGIPAEAHDAKVSYIFTPERCVRAKG